MVAEHEHNHELIHVNFILLLLVVAFDGCDQCNEHIFVQFKLRKTVVLKEGISLAILPHKKLVFVLEDEPHDLGLEKRIDRAD